MSYFLWLTAFLLTAFLANQHDHLFPREPLNQWEFSVLSENKKKKTVLGGLSGRRYFRYRVSPSHALLAFIFVSSFNDQTRKCGKFILEYV